MLLIQSLGIGAILMWYFTSRRAVFAHRKYVAVIHRHTSTVRWLAVLLLLTHLILNIRYLGLGNGVFIWLLVLMSGFSITILCFPLSKLLKDARQ